MNWKKPCENDEYSLMTLRMQESIVRDTFMYAYLKGTLEEITENAIVVEVGNIGYNVKVSSTTIDLLPGIGSEVKIYTYTLVRRMHFPYSVFSPEMIWKFSRS